MVNALAVTLMVLALGQPVDAPQAVDPVEAPVAKVRVYVGGVDAENVEQVFSAALAAGPYGAGSEWTGIGRRIVTESASDIFQFEEQARRSFSDSTAFELVQSLEMADYVMVMEADSISAGDRRRMRGVLKLVDMTNGEETYRRRVDFTNIASRSELNRQFSTQINLLEEWAVSIAG